MESVRAGRKATIIQEPVEVPVTSAAKDLRYFLKYVREQAPDEIFTVKKEVDPVHEITSVVRRIRAEGSSPIVYFERVKGYPYPMVTNIFGSRFTFRHILEVPYEKLLDYCSEASLRYISPRVVDKGPVHDVVMKGEDADLRKLPIVTHNEKDAHPTISSGLAIAKDPETGEMNMGVYRMMIKGPRTLSLNADPSSHLYALWKKANHLGKRLPVVVFPGHHPALYVASQHTGDEAGLAGSFLRGPLELAPCQTVDLEVPGYAEFSIEGTMVPDIEAMDGMFGEYTFLYGAGRNCPRFEISAITHRKDAIWLDIQSAMPDHVNAFLFLSETEVYRKVKEMIPQTITVRVPDYGVHHLAIVQVAHHQMVDGLGKMAGLAALAADKYLRIAVVVDDDIDIDEPSDIVYAISTRTRADMDLSLINYTFCSAYEPKSHSLLEGFDRGGLNTKIIIDATKTVQIPFPERAEPPARLWQRIELNEYSDSKLVPIRHVGRQRRE